MTKLTKQEQVEAMAQAKWPGAWKGHRVHPDAALHVRDVAIKDVTKYVERLHANGFEIVRKDQEDD